MDDNVEALVYNIDKKNVFVTFDSLSDLVDKYETKEAVLKYLNRELPVIINRYEDFSSEQKEEIVNNLLNIIDRLIDKVIQEDIDGVDKIMNPEPPIDMDFMDKDISLKKREEKLEKMSKFIDARCEALKKERVELDKKLNYLQDIEDSLINNRNNLEVSKISLLRKKENFHDMNTRIYENKSKFDKSKREIESKKNLLEVKETELKNKEREQMNHYKNLQYASDEIKRQREDLFQREEIIEFKTEQYDKYKKYYDSNHDGSGYRSKDGYTLMENECEKSGCFQQCTIL
jgi:chromosome segregation ATPase